MKIVSNSVVTLNYSVTDTDGVVVDDGKEPLVYLHGGHEDIFAKIEEALEGKSVDDMVKVTLHADEAFGEYDAELVQVESLDNLPAEVAVGMELEGAPAEDADEDEETIIYRVTDIAGDKATLDGNHPLAGMALIFTCTVTAVRPATTKELASGTVQGED